MAQIPVVTNNAKNGEDFPKQSANANNPLQNYDDLLTYITDQYFIFQKLLIDLAWDLKHYQDDVKEIIVGPSLNFGESLFPYDISLRLSEGPIIVNHNRGQEAKFTNDWLENLTPDQLGAIANTINTLHYLFPVINFAEIAAEKELDRFVIDWAVTQNGITYMRGSVFVPVGELWLKTKIQGELVGTGEEIVETPIFVLGFEQQEDGDILLHTTENDVLIIDSLTSEEEVL